MVFPIATAISRKHYGIVALLLAQGAKLDLDERDISRAQGATYVSALIRLLPSSTNLDVEHSSRNIVGQLNTYGGIHVTNYVQLAYQPLEVALKNHDDLSKPLISLNASVNFGLLESSGSYSDVSHRRTIKEWVDKAVHSLEKPIKNIQDKKPFESLRMPQ